ncbi:MAG: GNAT family N-acetyltransferase [Actinomycetota bacterium]|nr:GNAT family N-acetyltransferase [Actinomycetota bacterium]
MQRKHRPPGHGQHGAAREEGEVEIRALGVDDLVPLAGLFGRVPEGDLTFLKEDILDPDTVAAWPRDRRGRRFVALDEGEIAGYLAIVPGVGWCSHVGEVRVVVDPLRRRRGIGRGLAQFALEEAQALGMGKLVIEVLADQPFTSELFERLGFELEARLRNHLRDAAGRFRDLVLLACVMDERLRANTREEAPAEEAASAGEHDQPSGASPHEPSDSNDVTGPSEDR